MRSDLHDPKIAMLRRVPFLRGKSDVELARLARLVEHVTADPGTVLIAESTTGQEMFLIIDGWAEVSRDGVSLAAVGPGELVGEMAMLDHGARSATVTAKSKMSLLVLPSSTFAEFAAEPSVGRGIATQLTQRLRNVESAAEPFFYRWLSECQAR